MDCLQYINSEFQATQDLPAFATHDTLLELYRLMQLIRIFDKKAVNLQRTGKLGTFPSSLGQEAVSIGLGHAMHDDDVYCTYYRDQGAMLQRGVTLKEVLAYWGGDERGSQFANPKAKEDFPICVPIAGQCLHAAGVAYAIKYRQQQRAVITTIGEGGTSKGDFYEAMNVAGVRNLPMVFMVNNNQWAISVPREQQTAAKTIAQKAIAAGFEGIQVDGNDVIAVRQAAADAIEKARQGGGPTLIEAQTFRLCDHTTADDASRYLPDEQRKQAWKIEPITRLGFYLEAQGWWDREQEKELLAACEAEVDDNINAYLNTPKQAVTDCFDYLYETLPDALLDQRDDMEHNA